MKTFFTEVDSRNDVQLLRDIHQLHLRLNLDSPRTQLAMKELNVTRQQCAIQNLTDFMQYQSESKTMYLNHLTMLKELLTTLVIRRRDIIGPSVKISIRNPTKAQKLNIVKKIFDHDLKALYESEIQIKQAQQRNTDRLNKQIQDKFKISKKAKEHNQKVERKLSLIKERRLQELDDRLNKSLDFDTRFEPIKKSLQQSKIKFKLMMHSRTQQSLDFHREKKKHLIEQDEMRRTRLQYSMETSQRSTFFKQMIRSQDRIQQAQQINEEQQQKMIQKIGQSVEKNIQASQKIKQESLNSLSKTKQYEENKFAKVQKNINYQAQLQSQRENFINQDILDKINFTNQKAKERLQTIKEKMKQVSLQKQSKQQELLNKYIMKMEKKKDYIMEKHSKLRQNLKQQNKSQSYLKEQLIERDEHGKDIVKFQRLIVSKSVKNITELLNKFH